MYEAGAFKSVGVQDVFKVETAVLVVTGIKRTLADLLTRLTGQQLKYFDSENTAKDWLTED